MVERGNGWVGDSEEFPGGDMDANWFDVDARRVFPCSSLGAGACKEHACC